MAIHHVKASKGVFEAVVIPAMEVVENVAKFNWSKVAKGIISAKIRKVELLEAEMKAPGHESAYVVEAKQRFGTPKI
jgi:hypothetical protein